MARGFVYTTCSGAHVSVGVKLGSGGASTLLLLCPDERTSRDAATESVSCHKQTSHGYSITGAGQDRLRNFRAVVLTVLSFNVSDAVQG